eukprot:1602442-Amphidinium_carterae.1
MSEEEFDRLLNTRASWCRTRLHGIYGEEVQVLLRLISSLIPYRTDRFDDAESILQSAMHQIETHGIDFKDALRCFHVHYLASVRRVRLEKEVIAEDD